MIVANGYRWSADLNNQFTPSRVKLNRELSFILVSHWQARWTLASLGAETRVSLARYLLLETLSTYL